MQILRDIAYNGQNPGDLYLPSNASSTAVLVIHGGGWTSLHRDSMTGVADFLCENGLNVFNIEYLLPSAVTVENFRISVFREPPKDKPGLLAVASNSTIVHFLCIILHKTGRVFD